MMNILLTVTPFQQNQVLIATSDHGSDRFSSEHNNDAGKYPRIILLQLTNFLAIKAPTFSVSIIAAHMVRETTLFTCCMQLEATWDTRTIK